MGRYKKALKQPQHRRWRYDQTIILTPDELQRLEWCRSIMSEEVVVECQDEAEQIANEEFCSSKAYDQLLLLLVKIRFHRLRESEG